jgi:amidase
MTRTVRDAALVVAAMAGSDPADPQTAEADLRRADYAAGLSADALRGKRIGVMRFASGFGTDAPFEEALRTLAAQGAILVPIEKFERKPEMGQGEFKVLLTELKADLNAYLATTPATVATRTLADVIAFNKANAAREMPLFGQKTFEEAEKTKGLDDPEYRKARETSLRLAGAEGIDKMLKDNEVVALVGPTVAPAWLIDAVHGDMYPGGGAGGFAAVAGYPHLTVPMGAVKGLPVGLSFIGPKWADGLILSLGYAYEQASQKRVEPRFLPSIEESPEIAPHLRPAAAR